MTYALCPLIQLDIFTLFSFPIMVLWIAYSLKKKKTSFFYVAVKLNTVKIHCLAELLLSLRPCYTDLGANVMASS